MTQDKTIRDAKINGYLTGLSWALAGSDPDEREETLASMREHLEDSLPADASPEQVDQAIAALGPASAIAAESTPGYQPAFVHTPPNPTDWSAVMILAGGVASLFLIPLMPLAAILAVVILVAGIIKLRSKQGDRALTKGGMVAAGLTLIMLVIFLLGLVAFMDHGSDSGTQQVSYQQDE